MPIVWAELEYPMTPAIPATGDVVSLVEAFDKHPVGALLLCLLLLVIILGLWVYRSDPKKRSLRRTKQVVG